MAKPLRQGHPSSGVPRTEGVILAAGSSYRAGTFKPALQIGDNTMIARCIESMEGICSRIVVVGGHEFGLLRSLVEGMPNVECVENASYGRGMFTSVKLGLLCARGDRNFLLPADIPLVPRRVFDQLLAIDAPIVVPSFKGKRGHPVCLAKSVLPRILSQPDESSLTSALQLIGFREIEVDAEEILIDVDTPLDYERLLRRPLS